MRKMAIWAVLFCCLAGCAKSDGDMEQCLDLRGRILQAQVCSFDSKITADYGDKLHVFQVSCQSDQDGNVRFSVIDPEVISDISGTISDTGGKLTFDDTALFFDFMADDQLSPVSAPWIFLRALRGGCVTSAGMDGESLRVSVDDSYEEDALHLDIWIDNQNRPQRAEILYAGRRILSLDVTNFQIT